jgi:hypothetical protein
MNCSVHYHITMKERAQHHGNNLIHSSRKNVHKIFSSNNDKMSNTNSRRIGYHSSNRRDIDMEAAEDDDKDDDKDDDNIVDNENDEDVEGDDSSVDDSYDSSINRSRSRRSNSKGFMTVIFQYKNYIMNLYHLHNQKINL